MDDKRAEVYRQPCYLLELHMDMCTKLNPCIGSGASSDASSGGFRECNAVVPCYYTWFTCQDTPNYTKGTRVFKFCNREAYIPGAYPLMKKEVTHLPVKVNAEKFKTEVGELRLDFDDFPLSSYDLANPEKNIGDYSLNEVDGASFWVTWKARNKNYTMRLAKFYRGFVDLDPDDFELEFTGGVYDIAVNPKGARIMIRSFLWEASDRKFPGQVSDFIVLKTAITANALSLIIDDGSETLDATSLFDVATVNQPRTLKIEDEYITYTSCTAAAGGTTFSGLVRGAYGTDPVAHEADVNIAQVTVYAEDDGATWTDCSRVLADHCLMDLLMFYAKIGIDYIKTYDHDITITDNIDDNDTTIPVSSLDSLPEYGIIRIGDEAIWFRATLAGDLINCRRGQYGTTAAAHTSGDSVLVFGVTEALGHWHPGLSFKARFESEKDVAGRIETWRACAFANVWPDTDGKINVSLQVPPITTYSKVITDDDIVKGTKTWTGNDKTRKSRIQVWYRPYKPDPKTSGEDKLQDDYWGLAGFRDAEAENENVYGDVQKQNIYGEWLDDSDDAKWVADHIYTRVHEGINKLEASLELKDDDISLMDLLKLKIAEDADASGTLREVFYILTSKVKDGWSRIKLIFEQAGFGGNFRYAAIGPPNPTLAHAIDENDVTIDVDISGTSMTIDDFDSGGHPHQIEIEEEEITYTTATLIEESSSWTIVRLTGVDRTSAVAASHSAGVEVVLLYSSAADDFARRYAWIGDASNLLDGDGDLVAEENGYMIW